MTPSESIGIGRTDELTLRVSAASLARVVFDHPDESTRMLALEHKAYVSRTSPSAEVVVRAQPFGGAVRIMDPDEISAVSGGFNFDSERSRSEDDFRIFIHPSRLEALCRHVARAAGQASMVDLEIGPSRELGEEFGDSLDIQLQPEAYTVRPPRIVVQNQPTPTSNLRAPGAPTVRIYWIYEVDLQDPELIRLMLDNSQKNPGRVLSQMARDRYRLGTGDRANAVLVAPLAEIHRVYLATPVEKRSEPVPFHDTVLAGNVAAVVPDLSISKFTVIPAGGSGR